MDVTDTHLSIDVTYSDGSLTEASLSPEIPLPQSTSTTLVDETYHSQLDILSQYQTQQSPLAKRNTLHSTTNMTHSLAPLSGKISMVFNKLPLDISRGSLVKLPKEDLKALLTYCKTRMPTTATKIEMAEKILFLISTHKHLSEYKSRVAQPAVPHKQQATAPRQYNALSSTEHAVPLRGLFAPVNDIHWSTISSDDVIMLNKSFDISTNQCVGHNTQPSDWQPVSKEVVEQLEINNPQYVYRKKLQRLFDKNSFSIASHCKQSSTTIDSYIPKINIAPPQHLVTKLDECTQCDIENTVSVSGQTILQRLVTNTTFPVMHSFKTVVGSEEGLGITLEQVWHPKFGWKAVVKDTNSTNPATKHLYVGDALVAINDEIVIGKPLSSIVEMTHSFSKPLIYHFSNF